MAFAAFAMPLVEHNRHPQRRPNFVQKTAVLVLPNARVGGGLV